MLYLIVLGFVFAGNLLGDSKDDSLSGALIWVERIYLTLATLAFSGWKGQPLVHLSSDARSMITDVFAILAGFLMTVLTLVMEPRASSSFPTGAKV